MAQYCVALDDTASSNFSLSVPATLIDTSVRSGPLRHNIRTQQYSLNMTPQISSTSHKTSSKDSQKNYRKLRGYHGFFVRQRKKA